MEYTVTYRITGYAFIGVEANSMEEAEAEAQKKLYDMEFSNLNDIESDLHDIEDENGDMKYFD